ncbi:hypothetical protein GCM10009718_23330 [Isoptericola halotolerans]|uniref:NAD(P)-dependent oxidoreductase n=1 Tax=Isoptericola halotolerans TaxID=300560 RepID=UPI0031B56A4E
MGHHRRARRRRPVRAARPRDRGLSWFGPLGADGLGEALAAGLPLDDADVVVLAAALTDRTLALIGAPGLAAMKPGATLVNVARGALVDTDALVASLTSGRLGATALDVTDNQRRSVAGHTLVGLVDPGTGY